MIRVISARRLALVAALTLVVPGTYGDSAAPGLAIAAPDGAGAADLVEEEDEGDDDRNGKQKQEKGKKGKTPITVRGCLHGTTLGDVQAEEDVPDLTPSVVLRSSREIRRTLKEYDRHEVEITGVLTRAPRSPLSGKWGGTTVSVGAADPRRSPAQQTQPAVASMEVESVRSLSASCR